MSQAAKVQEPSMEEILASIRRIIADDEAKPPSGLDDASAPEPKVEAAPVASRPRPAPAPVPAPQEPEAMSQDDIDAMLAGLDSGSDSGPDAAEAAPVPADPVTEQADVLDLTEAMEARAAAAAPAFHAIDPDNDVVFADPSPAQPAAQAAAVPLRDSVVATVQPLLSEKANAAVTSAFGTLAHTVLAQNARTLDDLVREMLRPMLKDWLDDNLPTIVERLVRAEIERVSRGNG